MRKSFPWLAGISDEEVACVVAHPDDEVAFVHLLSCRPGIRLVQVTDGGPLERKEQQGYSREAYMSVRRRELDESLKAARHTGCRTALDITDGTVAANVLDLAQRLRKLFLSRHVRACFTHAYEGGHPDHDAIAFAVAVAAKQLPWTVKVTEAPLYRMDDAGQELVWQRFVPFEGASEIVVELDEDEQARKKKMFEAHASQKAVFSHISTSQEFFRLAPAYDFSLLPNDGKVSRYWKRTNIDEKKWAGIFQEVLDHM